MSNDSVTLSPAAFHILITLAAGNRHGYAIMKEVAATTAGQVQLNPGTLYTTIKRLLDEELIRETTTPSKTLAVVPTRGSSCRLAIIAGSTLSSTSSILTIRAGRN